MSRGANEVGDELILDRSSRLHSLPDISEKDHVDDLISDSLESLFQTNQENALFPPSSPRFQLYVCMMSRRRSQSVDIPLLHQSSSKGFVFCRPFCLCIQYKE